jgi:hypothetical protein
MNGHLKPRATLGIDEQNRRSQAKREVFSTTSASRKPARLLSMRASGRMILALIAIGTHVHVIRVTHVDHPELDILSSLDRATVRSALLTLHGGKLDAA